MILEEIDFALVKASWPVGLPMQLARIPQASCGHQLLGEVGRLLGRLVPGGRRPTGPEYLGHRGWG